MATFAKSSRSDGEKPDKIGFEEVGQILFLEKRGSSGRSRGRIDQLQDRDLRCRAGSAEDESVADPLMALRDNDEGPPDS